MKKMRKKRILMLIENVSYPQDVRVKPEAAALKDASYEISVISPTWKKQPFREEIDGIQVFRYPGPAPIPGFLGYLWEYGYSLLATSILTFIVFLKPGFDVIHAANPPDTAVLIAIFYKLLGKKFVFDHHDLSPELFYAHFKNKGNRFLYSGLLWLEKLSCLAADHIIATNYSYKKVEVERHGIPESRVTVVRNGPMLDRIHCVEIDQDLRKRARTIIGFVGSISFQDGVDYLLRALDRLVNELHRTDFYCVIIGKGDARESLIKLAGELHLNEYVWFTGYVPEKDMLRYLSTTDICVDPDPSNPFNDRCTMIKMMEYMTLGKPIVAFDLPEHRVTAQEAAIYAKPNEELDFAKKICQLMDDAELRVKMGQKGIQRVMDDLAWHYQVENLLEAYQTLLN